MPVVKVTDANLRDIITIECSWVPCVGEKIMLDHCDGGGTPYTVEYVSRTIYRNNTKPVDAMISIDFEDEDGEFSRWFNSDED
ncbi:MAG: hypothetical protein KZQ89_13295 [Candidatus Thiodiazotropha sp. (ex Lucinoma kastoroae)]|nr:hypothetical protein [Candidatus Thiodiazotropha sp. (ex Lucinoma kastoroae)]MCU7859581.1 hypothetical protein [Candidatus Thiodiazotropha sp. (ex Lucinoma kastoroae)]